MYVQFEAGEFVEAGSINGRVIIPGTRRRLSLGHRDELSFLIVAKLKHGSVVLEVAQLNKVVEPGGPFI